MKSMRRILVIIISVLFLPTFASAAAQGVPAARVARLDKGVNITRWFWDRDNLTEDHYRNYITVQQVQRIRRAGFTHVRLAVEPTLFLNEADPTQLDATMLKYLDAAIGRFTAYDLAVIVDMHPWEAEFKQRLMTDPAMQTAFASMWQTLAAHLSRVTSQKYVFLEVMNEAAPDNPEDWFPLQETFVKAIRAGAPLHTIIVGGPGWNSIDGLIRMKPLDDPNIIYNFHFYAPSIFTHQGATWNDDVIKSIRGIPYPSTNGRCGELPDFKNQSANEWAADYCTKEPWDATTINNLIKRAADWAAENNVPITANEFGVMPVFTPYSDRLQWFRDVRAAFEQYDIGWTVWGYDDGFGLDYSDVNGMDSGVLSALGMKVS